MWFLASAATLRTHCTHVSIAAGSSGDSACTNRFRQRVALIILNCVTANCCSRVSVMTHEQLPYRTIGVTTEWNSLRLRCSGTSISSALGRLCTRLLPDFSLFEFSAGAPALVEPVTGLALSAATSLRASSGDGLAILSLRERLSTLWCFIAAGLTPA